MSDPDSSRKYILFFTNCEYGQANVILAVAYELLLRDEFDVHIASFPELEPRIGHVNDLFRSQKRKESKEKESGGQENDGTAANMIDDEEESTILPRATFHLIRAASMKDIAFESELSMPHPPGIAGAIQSYQTMVRLFFGYDEPQYLKAFLCCTEILKKVDPTAIVSDPVCFPALDACKSLQKEVALLCPSSFKELVGMLQPRGAILWKYPQLSSGFNFPLPWWQIPANIYLTIRLIAIAGFGEQIGKINQCRKENGILGQFPSTEPYKPNRLHLCPALPEIDFPLAYIPDNVVGCGPIVLPAAPVSESDPSLASWLDEGPPTVLINLGSLIISDPIVAVEIAKGLRVVFDRFPNIRVLWKLKYEWTKSDKFYEILESEIESGQVRLPSWLVADPVSILASGKVVCSVHHGGANSYYEACRVGVPQVVLPVWYDTYDFANRVEWLGIGAHGNRKAAPSVEASEFAKALTRALEDEKMISRAKEIGKLCGKLEGREVACEKISDWIRG